MPELASNSPEREIQRLRKALDEETRRCIGLENRLDRANQSFEEFVSVAAHNLRDSLRTVASFSELLAGTYAAELGPDAADWLSRIQEGAVDMQSLLAAVVDYWAIGTTGTISSEPARTDMEAVLSQALLLAERQIAERSATVTHDPLPEAGGDFATLTKVLHHLIGNAIEYCAAAVPRVHISSRREDSEWVFSVQDNGPGIEPAFQSRVFGPFKRLHGKEYPGNGLGLAFCKKAIEWHGGRMWVESACGEGAAFYFTTPLAG